MPWPKLISLWLLNTEEYQKQINWGLEKRKIQQLVEREVTKIYQYARSAKKNTIKNE